MQSFSLLCLTLLPVKVIAPMIGGFGEGGVGGGDCQLYSGFNFVERLIFDECVLSLAASYITRALVKVIQRTTLTSFCSSLSCFSHFVVFLPSLPLKCSL